MSIQIQDTSHDKSSLKIDSISSEILVGCHERSVQYVRERWT